MTDTAVALVFFFVTATAEGPALVLFFLQLARWSVCLAGCFNSEVVKPKRLLLFFCVPAGIAAAVALAFLVSCAADA